MPASALVHSCYFTLRSGGKTLITFIFDSVFMWVVNVSTGFIISRFTTLPIIPMFIIVQSEEIIKAVIGLILVKSKRWVQTLVNDKAAA